MPAASNHAMNTTIPHPAPPAGRLQKFHVLGQEITLRVGCEETADRYYVFEGLAPAGAAVPPHVHQHEDEIVYVLEGEFEVLLGGETFRLKAGESRYFPRHVVHGFTNVGVTTARTLFFVSPGANFARFFEELSALPAHLPPDPEKAQEIFARYQIDLVAAPEEVR